MGKIPVQRHPLSGLVMKAVDEGTDLPPVGDVTVPDLVAEDWRRDHLGGSQIGKECWREIWYGFRWALRPALEGRILRLFDHGHWEEARAARDINRVPGVELTTRDEDGGQFQMDAPGHLGGSLDGKLLGYPGAPKTLHLWDHKTANEKQFKAFMTKGLKLWKPVYWAQGQVYMHWSKIKRAVFTVENKNDDSWGEDRFAYERDSAQRLERKGLEISLADRPPPKAQEDPAKWGPCKWCDFKPICHEGKIEKLERSCRTCTYVTAKEDGTWECGYTSHPALSIPQPLTPAMQREGCIFHHFNPHLIPGELTEFNEASHEAVYTLHDGRRLVDSHCSMEVR